MLHKTRGIVIHFTNYSESSVVAKVYTEAFGIQSYLINSVRSKKGKVKQNMLQPLTLLNLVVYHKDRPGLQRISEINLHSNLNNIHLDIRKSALTIFLAEFLNKTLHEEEANPELFEFLIQHILLLNELEEEISLFHLHFMLGLTKFLGFLPGGIYSETNKYFDLKEGIFVPILPTHSGFIKDSLAKEFSELLLAESGDLKHISLSKNHKKDLLSAILSYYHHHISGFGEMKSLSILEEIFN